MSADVGPAVAASNELTGRWVAGLDSRVDHLVSGFSAWHLLSILATGATGAAKDELTSATRIDTIEGPSVINALFDELATDMASGLGLWVRPDLALKQSFADQFPAMTIDAIPDDSALLDQWVSNATGGILNRFPVPITDDTRLAAATALGLDVEWREPFNPGLATWSGTTGHWFAGLSRTQTTQDNAAVVLGTAATVSRYVCEANGNIDVHLFAGESSDSVADVLQTAIEAVAGVAVVEPIDDMPVGTSYGCMSIETAPGSEDSLIVALPAFHLEADHDLTEQSDLFGLHTARDSSSGHFDHIAGEPLAIEQVAQATVADFTATGFRAGAVTAALWMAGAAMPTDTCTLTRFSFDRPFGMLAVHRPTNLILFAGWIATTDALRNESDSFQPPPSR